MIVHFVLLKGRPEHEAELTEALARFETEIRELETVLEITSGRNFNRGADERGWTHGVLVRLPQSSDLPGYWDHPAHLRLVEVLERTCTDRFAVDYETNTEPR